MRRPTVVDKVMNEVTLYGGIAMRRADAYTLASEHMGESAGGRFGADWFAFGGPRFEVPEGRRACTLEEAREILSEVNP